MRITLKIEKKKTKYTIVTDLVDLLTTKRRILDKKWQQIIKDILNI